MSRCCCNCCLLIFFLIFSAYFGLSLWAFINHSIARENPIQICCVSTAIITSIDYYSSKYNYGELCFNCQNSYSNCDYNITLNKEYKIGNDIKTHICFNTTFVGFVNNIISWHAFDGVTWIPSGQCNEILGVDIIPIVISAFLMLVIIVTSCVICGCSTNDNRGSTYITII